ncbi:MAG TPA: TlpA disulfide reductase family protein [Mycetocola sp.]|jgi:thiol-disulfide isomerase/thioredoxin|uniref:TlpA family protein disulfide reductase n=1 Tax=Mycetocola sp. TaxID=1871042 RepID=UPI00261310B2|nr:TlpA disulfide reductase family protein [Mycetocola sp.]MCU1560170.1 Thiol-disulfide isomerase or thioredoxin [Mycetocola sp.]HEV7849446.1 TlpA disulfide reductase family protein [Mycetocola sp.]
MRVAAIGIAAVLLLTGCASDPLAEQYKEGSNKGYIAGDGSVTEIPEAERGDSISFAGATESGEKISSEDFPGEVLVVNFWYAACAPCRAEAPDLQELSAEYDGKGAQFIGVNVYDQADTALSFNETYGITYPSILDVQDGAVKLAFTGTVPPKAVPTTIVLDKEGRVSARILGQLKEASILGTLIRDAIEE